MLKTRMSAPLMECKRSGSATRLWGRSILGRYLTFWCLVFMISVRFSSPIFSSKTHILTSGSKIWECNSVFSAMTLAMVVPQLPEPITVTLKGARFKCTIDTAESDLLIGWSS
uniref:DNA from chromosome XV (contains gpd3, arg1, gpm3, sp2, gal11 genes) n=1 Tax=Saccharomyces cerevisiae TaxID=4932 RepID=E9PA96_YEASX|nr:unnamed protein product [Saccharomyces cerevisiae]